MRTSFALTAVNTGMMGTRDYVRLGRMDLRLNFPKSCHLKASVAILG
jgi:hypothetical protein